MMKSIALTAALVVLTAGVAAAKPYSHNRGASHYGASHKAGKLTFFERVRIARNRARLQRLKRRVRADGIVTRRERARVIVATRKHRALVRKERRD